MRAVQAITPTINPWQVHSEQASPFIFQATLADLEAVLRKVLREVANPAETRLKDVAFTLNELGAKLGVSSTTIHRINARGFLTSSVMTTDNGSTVYNVEQAKQGYKRYKEYIKANH